MTPPRCVCFVSMNPRLIKFSLVALVGLALVGCSSSTPGEVSRPVPSWSPPTWMHGKWVAPGASGQATIVASRYNLVLQTVIGASSVTIDLADGAERGSYTIRHDAGTWHETGDSYYELTLTSGSADPVYLFFSRVDSSRIALWETDPLNPNLLLPNPTVFSKQ